MLVEAPAECIDSVLSEERLTLEYEGGHTPVSRFCQGLLVLLDLLEVVGPLDGSLHLGKVEPRASRRVCQVPLPWARSSWGIAAGEVEAQELADLPGESLVEEVVARVRGDALGAADDDERGEV